MKEIIKDLLNNGIIVIHIDEDLDYNQYMSILNLYEKDIKKENLSFYNPSRERYKKSDLYNYIKDHNIMFSVEILNNKKHFKATTCAYNWKKEDYLLLKYSQIKKWL